MWVIGGLADKKKNDVWFSSDGVNWIRAIEETPWEKRAYHQCVVYNGKIWIIGGLAKKKKSDVWYSSDCINWTQVTPKAPWSERFAHSSVIFNNKIWVLGGNNKKKLNDVWYSSDGANWTKVEAKDHWSKRMYHQSIVYNEKIWILGGLAKEKESDVWYSSDGTNWTASTYEAPWTKRFSHHAITFQGLMWVIGGNDGKKQSDIWYSDDGFNWRSKSIISLQIGAIGISNQYHISLSFHTSQKLIQIKARWEENNKSELRIKKVIENNNELIIEEGINRKVKTITARYKDVSFVEFYIGHKKTSKASARNIYVTISGYTILPDIISLKPCIGDPDSPPTDLKNILFVPLKPVFFRSEYPTNAIIVEEFLKRYGSWELHVYDNTPALAPYRALLKIHIEQTKKK